MNAHGLLFDDIYVHYICPKRGLTTVVSFSLTSYLSDLLFRFSCMVTRLVPGDRDALFLVRGDGEDFF